MRKKYRFDFSVLKICLLFVVLFGVSSKALAAPVIIEHPYNRTICESGNTFFTVVASSADSYLWQVSNDGGVNWETASGSIYSGATTDTLKLVGAYQTAQYRCIIQGGGSQVISNIAMLNFFIIEHAITAASTQLCRNDSTAITMASSQPGINYYLRGGNITKGPYPGTGHPINFNTGVLYSTQTFSILAQKSAVGNSLKFDGMDDFVVVSKSIGVLNTFTLSMYVFPVSANAGKIISSSSYEVALANGGIVFNATGIGTVNYPSIPVNVWTYVAITYDGSNLHLYFNGTEMSSSTASGAISSANSITLGREFNGALDEMRLRDKCLSTAEVRASMTDCISGKEEDVRLYYRFDDGVGSPVLSDISGKGLNGKLMNMDFSNCWILGTSACGDNLACSKSFSQTIKITVANLPPTVTTYPSAHCGKGSVILSATSNAGTISWYTTATGGTPIATGSNYKTPDLNATTAYFVSANDQGCVSKRMEVVATIRPKPDVSLTVSGEYINVNQTGALYQWVDCRREKQPIPLATNISYKASITGDYAVIVLLDGCKDTSTCVKVIVNGVENIDKINKLLVYPNPSNGAVTIQSTTTGVYLLMNELGQQVMTISLTPSNSNTVMIDNLVSGVYFLADMTREQPNGMQKIIIAK